jgi:hypothetical protein
MNRWPIIAWPSAILQPPMSDELLCEASLGLAILFKEMNNPILLLSNATLSLNTAKKRFSVKGPGSS